MSWETFYLLAFFVGFLLSLVSIVGGLAHFPHLHVHMHGPAHAAGSGVAHPGAAGGKAGVKGGGGRASVSPFNFGTFAAFLAWFGGAGFLMERYSGVWVYLGLLIAIVSGLCGAGAVFWFLAKLMKHERPLDPADYEMVGVLAKVGSPIREGGTGEVMYQRDGSRKAAPARSEDGSPIPRDCEVIVTRFERGVAYVKRWDEMSGERF